MTSPMINGAEATFFAQAMVKTKAEEQNQDGMFQSILTQSKAEELPQTVKGSEKSAETAYQKQKDSGNSVKEKVSTTETSASKDDKTQTDVTKETSAEISKDAEQVKEEVAKELDVTKEEVEAVMENMGLLLLDLLNPETVNELCLEITGMDEVSLLTDGDLYQSIQNLINTVNEMVTELSEELGIDLETLDPAILENLEIPMDEEANEFLLKDGEELKEVELVEVKVEQEQVTEEEQLTVSHEPTETLHKTETSQKEEHEGKENHLVEAGVKEQFHVELEAQPEVAKPGESFLSEETKNIMDQMVESMKLEVSEEVTELKLQLHPESLGNVHVQLQARDGMVTASFTAQNEVVKNVLEGQMIELKETLEQKGIQVEAVEVKVDTGAFNEQYSDQQKGESEELFENEVKKLRTRNINLLFDSEEELSEEEELSAKIMKENGNSLDYMA